ncbi:conserved membrane hypothetical protein [Vibrio nigripulchritudo SOn1]|uniref:Uncharacterized protein n=1 Tax=Vibrio nigripulchritudo SOn1 TaxID=1238450 RepID=A0AAV2VQK6_9VIBR|nr:hypothetical protein [Vibrio nigripulchritudo]CCO46825.1 conserved membrane hypothetical protein [Vibrio nigripulchritudo SOn1]
MNEDDLPVSDLERVLDILLTKDIPALYFLFERLALAMSAIYFISACMSLLRVRALTGQTSMSSMQMSESSPTEIFAKFGACIFLGSFGLGQAVISNTIFLGNFEPYSIEVIRSISCSVDDMSGCVHYELGMFADGSWTKATINETFFEFFTGLLAITGTICYFIGWTNFAKLGSQRSPRTFWQCVFQIFIGAFLMRPTESWQMFTGGFGV